MFRIEFLLLSILSLDVVEAELVGVLVDGNNTRSSGQYNSPKFDKIIDTDRIQSRRVFFLRNFLVRYLRYRLERAMFEVTVMDLSPDREESTEASDESSDTGRTITVDLDVVTELASLALEPAWIHQHSIGHQPRHSGIP